MSAYVFFVRERYAALKLKQPDLRFGDASKLLGSEWATMDTSAKAKFVDMAAADMARYEKETGADKEPKRAKSAYVFFVRERYAALKRAQPELDFGELSKALGEEWGKMDRSAKAKYEALSQADTARYEREAKIAGIGKVKKKKSISGRPTGPFFVFCKEKRAQNGPELRGCSMTERSKVLGEIWQRMTPAERAPYYTDEYKQWIASRRKLSGPRNPYEEYVHRMCQEDPSLSDDTSRTLSSIHEELSIRWKGLSAESKEEYRTPEYIAFRAAKRSGASMLILGQTTEEQLEVLGNDRFALYALEQRVQRGAVPTGDWVSPGAFCPQKSSVRAIRFPVIEKSVTLKTKQIHQNEL